MNFSSLKKTVLLTVLAFFYSQLAFSQTDTPCGAPALTVGGSCVNVTGDWTGNTWQDNAANGGSPSCGVSGGPLWRHADVWYSFVVPASGLVNIQATRINLYQTYTYAAAAVYSGPCASLTEVACNYTSSPSVYPTFNLSGLTPGATYYLRIWDVQSSVAADKTFDICAWEPAPPPPIPANDECANATPAVVNTDGYCDLVTPGTIAGATESSESYYCWAAGSGDADDDVWFSFVAVNSTQYVGLRNIQGSTTNLSTSVHVGTFCGSSGVNALSCSEVVNGLTVGNTYYVRVWSNGSASESTTFDLCITSPPPMPTCTANPVAGNTACTATPICNLNGYCGTTSSSYSADSWTELFNEAAGCFPDIDNNSFLELTAVDTTISFWVWVDNCNQPNGIQIMVFSANNCGSGPVVNHSCYSPGVVPVAATLVYATGLTVGEQYYIMIDGNAGAVCDYIIAAHEGFLTDVAVAPVLGDTSICLGESVDLYATGGFGNYIWSPATGLNSTNSDTVTSTPPSAGSLTYTVTSASTNPICPSDTAEITLTIGNAVNITDVQTACDSFMWIDGVTYTSNTNIPTFTAVNPSGCDTVYTLDLTISNTVNITDVQAVCDSLTWLDGVTYTASTNIPTFTAVNPSGCDTVYTLDLTISNTVNITDVQAACDSLTWLDGVTYTASTNIPTFIAVNPSGCDTVYTLDLTISNTVNITDVQAACDSLTWLDGVTYTASTNIPTFTAVNPSGCDTVYTLDLTISTTVNITDVQAACDSLTWLDGVTYTASTNIPTFTAVNPSGCDTVYTLDLTISNTVNITDVQAACDSLTWLDGVTYTASTNIPTFTAVNPSGCDTVYTLDLTISSTVNITDVQAACDSYTWLDGVTYTASTNIPTFTAVNPSGCDTVYTLDLTISTTVNITDVQTACDSYTWLDGVTYTASTNIPTFTAVNPSGCDTVYTLDLTISNTVNITDVQAACGSYTWLDGVTYTTSTNTPTYTAVSTTGCDTVYTLDLTLGDFTSDTTSIYICSGDSVTLGQNVYTQAGTYYDTVNASPCDSVLVYLIDLYTSPSVTATVDSAEVTEGSEVQLSATGSDNASVFWTSDAPLSDANIFDPTSIVTLPSWFVVLLTDTNTFCNTTDSVFVDVIDVECTNSGINLPTAFTPNNDGKNDLLDVFTLCPVRSFELNIFNRWGELVFQSNDPMDRWDGNHKGVIQAPDVFVYLVNGEYTNGKSFFKKGSVTLLR